MAEHSFYIDKTAPVLAIENIIDESANNKEEIGFVMKASDTNFDVFMPVLTAVVKNGNTYENKQIDVGEFSDITNGKMFTVKNVEADGIYRIMCTLVDKAGNVYNEVILDGVDGKTYAKKCSQGDTLLTFSVNRNGSTFEIDEKTIELIDRYYNQNVNYDIVVYETNVDTLKEYSVILNGKELVENTDYTVTYEGGNGNWYKYKYTVNKGLFDGEGEYVLVVSSKDKADNDAFSDVKNATIKFVIDRTAPVVTVSGMDNNGRYQTENQLVTLMPTDDGGMLKTLIVRLVDNNGTVIKELVNLSEEALHEALENNDGKITFEIAEGLYQNVQIICSDYASGEGDDTNTNDITYSNISVSSSIVKIFWANKPLRWGTIAGVIVLIGGLTALIVLKKKKVK